uniref:Uncharacterized protein n=1 Tax=Heterorhabditis bacteriophora TaxID=37862 RepID=A0A1I7WAL1_HETBA
MNEDKTKNECFIQNIETIEKRRRIKSP